MKLMGLSWWRNICVAALIECLLSVPSSYGFVERNPERAFGRHVPRRMINYEYEYIPPNTGAESPFSSDLPSIYPEGTPAGMKGEAVRSALRSGRCICWNLGESALEQGWLSLQGKGVLDFLNNKLTSTVKTGKTQTSCLLNAKGKVVDQLTVACLDKDKAFVLTSPGYQGSKIFQQLDPLIFPMDRVRLDDQSEISDIFTLASTKALDAQIVIESYVKPLLPLADDWCFPDDHSAVQMNLLSGGTISILSTSVLPEVASQGYTIILTGHDQILYKSIWKNLVSEDSPEGPVEIGPLEFENIRIEAGMPAYGKEYAGDNKDAKISASPLELHLDALVDTEKGCYLGQEGVAAIAKNKRGPPRLLYSVVFEDTENVYAHESKGDRSNFENLTILPEEGKEICVLGSNEEISVGILTSVAEPSGTGDPKTLAMALVKRADSIMKAMRAMDLEIDRSPKDPFKYDPLWNGGNAADLTSVMIQPPPIDPLDGLEVIVKGTYTVGVLKCIASRRYRKTQNMFLDVDMYVPEQPKDGEVEINRIRRRIDKSYLDAVVENAEGGKSDAEEEDDGELARAMEVAEAEVAAAAAEAERKTKKLEMLKQRAEEAKARRKAKSETVATVEEDGGKAPAEVENSGESDEAAKAEAARKAEKMEMLQQRAKDAMARRKAKQESNDNS